MNDAFHGGCLLHAAPMLVASTSEMHDILVAMQRDNSGGRQETTLESARNLRM